MEEPCAWIIRSALNYRDGHETASHSDGADTLGRERGAANPFDTRADNILAKVFYQANSVHRFGLALEYFNMQQQGKILSNEGYSINMAPGVPMLTYTDNRATDEDQRQRLSFEHKWQANTAAFDVMEWQLAYQQSHAKHSSYDFTTGTIGYGQRDRNRNGEDESVQFNGQFNKSFDLELSYHELVYGVSYINNQFDLDYYDYYYGSRPSLDKSPEVPNARAESYGVFIQDQGFYLNDKLVVNLGLRYDYFSQDPQGSSKYEESSEDAITARIGTVYHWNEQFSSFAQVSQGFKAPSLYDLYYEYNTGEIWLPNPDLKPEESIGYEIGSRYGNAYGRIELVAFYNDYKNFIEQQNIGVDADTGKDISTNVNIASAEIYGAELSSKLALDKVLSAPTGGYAQFNLAYSRGQDSKTKVAIDSVAPLTGYLALGFDDQNQVFGGKVALQLVAGKSGGDWSQDDNIKAAGYGLTDITAYYRPLSDLTLRAGVFNVFDEKYWLYNNLTGKTDTSQGLDRHTEPGRNWGLNLEYAL